MGNDRSIVDRFERMACAHPDRPAIRMDGRGVTYGTLQDLTGRVAHALLGLGVGAGDRVALLFDRDPAAVAALFGVMKSAAIAVPLSPSHPPDRLRQILADADPVAMVSDRRHAAAARALVGSRVTVVEIDALPSAPDRDWPIVEIASPAVLLYTSGSSGTPKGVLQAHGFLLHKCDRVTRVLAQGPGDRMTFFGSYALGQGVSTIMQAMLSGATLCMFDVRRDGLTRLVAWLVEERITIFMCSVSLFRNLTRILDGRPDLPDLRLMRMGSERLTPDDVAAHERLFPGVQLFFNYSTTETGAIAMYPVDPDTRFPGGRIPVGRPLDGLTVRILGEGGQELECGEEGEIAVQCEELSLGYWRDRERTDRVFAGGGGPGKRFYRTGDLGRLRQDGLLELLGRKDFRVKIRGFRIELEEIETVLGQDPDVYRAAVAARSDAAGDQRLVAYVQLTSGSVATTEALRARLAARLPEYMVPSTFVMMDVLPQTDSGKPARQLLPDPPADRPVLSSQCVLPRNAVEVTIAAVWREVLGLDTVGVDDEFLSLGGDSLKATLVASRLASRMGVDLPLGQLFEASTISKLASAVEQQLART